MYNNISDPLGATHSGETQAVDTPHPPDDHPDDVENSPAQNTLAAIAIDDDPSRRSDESLEHFQPKSARQRT
jgi:hypothetical protein